MAKIRASGADTQLLGAFETTYGTAPSGAGGGVYRKLSFKSHALGSEQPLGTDPLLGMGRDAQDPYYDAISVSGDIVAPVDLRGIGFWLRGLFGAPVTTEAEGVYTHVFTSGGALPSLALQVGHMQLSPQVHFAHAGVKLGSLAFQMARTGAVNATIATIAQGETSAATALDAAPLEFALTRFSAGRGTIKLDGSQVAAVTGGNLTYSNNLEGVETIRDDGKIDGVDEGEATATGGLTVRFGPDSPIRAAVAAQSPVALEYAYSIPDTDYLLKFELPRVYLPKPKTEISGPGGIEATYNWQAARDPVAGYLLRATLVNDVDGY
ncbi:phage tail tube protein [Oleispirillum naphthae]|uniref:phage tail tube protein n=1 Tax=Oleispirillum naphthae TaxID=2838853 RepID=UPI00308243EB